MSTANFDPRDRTEPDCEGRLRLMARSGGFVMVRYPRMQPFVLTEKKWAKLARFDEVHIPKSSPPPEEREG